MNSKFVYNKLLIVSEYLDGNGGYALSLAFKNGEVEVLKYLMQEQGLDLNFINNDSFNTFSANKFHL